VLSQFGIHTTILVAVLGAASLAVGLALQGTLSNLAAGGRGIYLVFWFGNQAFPTPRGLMAATDRDQLVSWSLSMLLIFRPFRIGHKVQIGGSVGTVNGAVVVLD
jgi:small conductance mechanosensitive channel